MGNEKRKKKNLVNFGKFETMVQEMTKGKKQDRIKK